MKRGMGMKRTRMSICVARVEARSCSPYPLDSLLSFVALLCAFQGVEGGPNPLLTAGSAGRPQPAMLKRVCFWRKKKGQHFKTSEKERECHAEADSVTPGQAPGQAAQPPVRR